MHRYFRRVMVASVLFSGIFASLTSFADNPHAGISYPVVKYDTGKQADLIRRGEYLAKAGDCIACHTDKEGGAVFSGGLPMPTPFGTFYSPNITPDKQTGLGNWTEDQFITVMQEGIRPDGTHSFPVFPYLWFSRIDKPDLQAIWAYLQAVPAVQRENKKEDVPWPFSWRFTQTFWKFFAYGKDNQPYQYDAAHSPEWNRGAYLVQGLGHCGMCHTPINFMGIPKSDYDLTGSPVSGMMAPNITSTGPIGKASLDQIVAVFKKGDMIGGGQVAGGMAEAVHNSLSYLSDADARDMAIYLKSFKSKKQPPKVSIEGTGLAAGKSVYESTCYACHDNGSGGAPQLGNKADWEPLIAKGTPVLYANAIHGINGMPAMGTCSSCTNQQVQDAVDYMVNAAQSSSVFTQPKHGPAYPTPTMADAKKIYMENCSGCHADGSMGAPIVGNQQDWAPRIQQGIPMLFNHAVNGYEQMPARGGCTSCNDAEIKCAVVYMVQQSKTSGDYTLWLQNN